MRKTILQIAALFMACTTLQAQTKTNKADITWGPELSDPKNGDFLYVIDNTDDAIYQVMRVKHDLFIQRMDMDLKVVYQKPLELELGKKDLVLKNILITADKVVVFTSYYDKKEDENQLYASTYDQAGFIPVKRNELIARIPAEKSRNSGDFSIKLSDDRSTVMVYMEKPIEKEVRERFDLQLYDADMDMAWSKEVELPYDADEFSVKNVLVLDDGSVLCLGMRYAEKQERRELKRAGEATYEHHLVVFTKDSDLPQDHPITNTGKFLQDMSLKVGSGGDIICGGFFSNKGTMSIRGTFFLRLDRVTKEVVHESYKEFSDGFITEYMTAKESKKAEKKASKKKEDLEMYTYDIDNILVDEKGGAVMVAEQYYMYTVTTTSSTPNGGTTTTTSYHYIYNDIIVVNIDPEGDIVWTAKVPKRQHSVNDGGVYSSYALNVKGDNIYLIFNDSGENLFVKPGSKIKQFELKGKDALVVMATVDKDGQVTREALFSPERRESILRPRDCVELGNEDMFIYASRKKDYRFGMIKFE